MFGIWIFPSWDAVNLTTFFFNERSDSYVEGYFNVYSGFLGYEFILLVFPHIDSRRKNFTGVFLGNLVTTIIYMYICIVAFGFYSFGQLMETLYPTLLMFQYIEFSFLERIDTLIYPFFLLNIIVTITLYFWPALHISERLFPKIKVQWLLIFLLLSSYLATTRLDIQRLIEEAFFKVTIVEFFVAFGLPLLLLCLLGINNMTKRKGTI